MMVPPVHSVTVDLIVARTCAPDSIASEKKLTSKSAGDNADHLETPLSRISSPVSARLDSGAVIVPLSPYQESLWFLHHLSPTSAAYHISATVRLTGSLSVAALEYSLERLVQRHDALRTTLTAAADRQPYQIIHPILEPQFSFRDLRDFPAPERILRAREVVQIESNCPFDLEAGPLMRVLLLRLDDFEHHLLLVLHHIVSDAWSLVNCAREIMVFYKEYLTGDPAWTRSVVAQYSDFSVQQRNYLKGERLEQLRTYWLNRLDGLEVLEMPTDHPRPPGQTFDGALLSRNLDPDLWRALRRLSSRLGVTPHVMLLAAFDVMIHRYTGKSDLGVATPVATRGTRSLHAALGMLVNTVVIRTDMSGDPTFVELIERVGSQIDEAFAHQEIPFAQVVTALKPDREGGFPPLAQIMFSMVNVPCPKLCLQDLESSILEIEREGAQFDLTCSVTDIADMRGRLAIEYNTALFDEKTIERMLAHYSTLLASIVADPQQPISRLAMINETEREQLLVTWNRTDSPTDLTQTLPQMLADQARRTPEALAVVCEPKRYTYEEFDHRSNQVAQFLESLGVGPGKPVGIAMRRSADLVVALVGVMKCGGVYVPLDPAYARARLNYMLADSGAKVLITEHGLLSEFERHANHVQIVYLDDDWMTLTERDELAPAFRAHADDLAYIMYTSGSTGEPKGVGIPHRALTNFLHSMAVEPGITSKDCLLAVTSPSFDISLLELTLPLTTGATVVIVDERTAADGVRLKEAMEQCQASIMQATPATWRLLVDSGWAGSPDLKLLCGGEELTRDLAQELLKRCGSLWNMYGPTETTIWSAVHRVSAHDEVIPIGRPIANTQLYVLDAAGEPAGIGVPGELCIGGAGLARGYINKPERTDQAFVEFFADGSGRLIYKTGDVARFQPDGTLRFMGRLDHQVKVRGYRIELGEIEAALREHESVGHAVTVTRTDHSGMQSLVAFVVPATNQVISPAVLRSFVRNKLPPYMVPSAIVPLQEIPRLPNGKTNRRALIEYDGEMLVRQEAPVGSPDALERSLVDIWEDILEVGPIGVNDDFFDLGGHSLLSAQLMAEISQQFGVQPSLASFLQGPTVRELAALIRKRSDATQWSPLVSLQPGGDRPPLYLVHGLGGGVSGYVALARLLGRDQPVYGFEALGSDNDSQPDTSIEEMARRYADALITAQPEGPFCLGGYSYGAAVAYEMACQLAKRGRRCACLVLIDSAAPGSDYYTCTLNLKWLLDFLANFPNWLQDFRQLERDRQRARILKAIRSNWPFGTASRISQPIDRLMYLDNVSQIPDSHKEIVALEMEAIANYSPSKYDGDVVLFRTPRHPLFCSYDKSLGWDSLVSGEVNVRYISGAHHRLMAEPTVLQVASQISQSLVASVSRV